MTGVDRGWTSRLTGLYRRSRRLVVELLKFGIVGVIAALVDVGFFNVFLVAVGLGPIPSKVLSNIIATTVAYVGNRQWTFRDRDRTGLGREYVLFFAFNLAGLGISVLCLVVSHYGLGLRSVLADNVAGNVVGFVLSTGFRFYAYRRWVFPAGLSAGGLPTADVRPS